MRHQRITTWTALVAAFAMTVPAVADDRDFLREVAAAPNLIFILDTSSSMVLSPEVTLAGDPLEASPVDGALVAGANVPGGGDDPYSRMGIAKRVLRSFLADVGEANVAFAGYAQAQPALPDVGVPQKHWVYEARAQDRFHMIEATYAYRMGYAENHAGVLLDVPADIEKNRLIGYKPYFNSGIDITDRFGPLNAYDSGYVDYTYQNPIDGEPDIEVMAPFDLMPIYFGNCFVDNRETPADPSDDETVCADNVFPFYDSGIRDTATGDLIPSVWYYGQADSGAEDYPGCDPNDPIWDDGFGSPVAGACQNAWEETSGADLIQYQRRVRLQIPPTYGGNPNHFLASDGSGGLVGNVHAPDGGAEDYDLDGFADPDYDGDEAYDWILYVDSVEERSERTCSAGALLPTLTPTATYTQTPTLTPTPTMTPTPIVDCAKITITSFGRYSTYHWSANISNQLNSEIVIARTEFTWIPYNASHYVDYFSLNYMSTSSSYLYYPGNSYATPTEYVTNLGNATEESAADIPALDTTNMWYARMYPSYTPPGGFHQVCFDFTVYNLPTAGANWSCPNICREDWGSANTPTPTLTPSLTPTETPYIPPTSTPGGPTPTRTNTPSGGGPTPTWTPTTGILPTSTPTPWPTSTPTPPPTATPTPQATPTFTPVS